MTPEAIRKVFRTRLPIGYDIEQAYGKRKCHQCKEEIIKNEWMICSYKKSQLIHRDIRTNTCLLCAMPMLKERQKATATFLKAAKAYMKEKPEIANRRTLRRFQEGTLTKDEGSESEEFPG